MESQDWYVLLPGGPNVTASVLGPFASEREAHKHAQASGHPDPRVLTSRKLEPPAPRPPVEPEPRDGRMRMPFGKHRGEALEDIPTGYLEWCLREMDNLRPALAEEMEAQIQMRAGRGVVRSKAE